MNRSRTDKILEMLRKTQNKNVDINEALDNFTSLESERNFSDTPDGTQTLTRLQPFNDSAHVPDLSDDSLSIYLPLTCTRDLHQKYPNNFFFNYYNHLSYLYLLMLMLPKCDKDCAFFSMFVFIDFF